MMCYLLLVLFLVLWDHSQALQEGFHFVPLTDEMKQEFVDAHNLARSNVEPSAADMQMVEWDDEIAEVARKIVNYPFINRKCEFSHSHNSERRLPEYPYGLGENIFVGMSKYHSDKPGYMTHKWDEERKFYNYDDLSCLSGKMCGHYTQVVWSSTTKIGCAIGVCPQGIKYTWLSVFDLLTICHYGPPGNWKGRKPYTEGEPCTACPANMNNCENNMCSSS